ncbi:A-kinase anchor protein 200 isoform X2 [Aethina tumida]|uniref:A-kinase anchor protein 200 isoform X2 n=1 Tax=Aethina tumida TaxID=116153 RepID=UPI002147AA7A|nr:A-kinase anchor protein 200 isoform X2 [Aethina tumida]
MTGSPKEDRDRLKRQQRGMDELIENYETEQKRQRSEELNKNIADFSMEVQQSTSIAIQPKTEQATPVSMEEDAGQPQAEPPKSGEVADVPKSGEAADALKSGEDADAPKSGEAADEPKSGEAAEAPKSGEAPDAPKSGEAPDVPKSGEGADAPKSGEAADEPKSGEAADAPKSGEVADALKSGGAAEPPGTEGAGELPKSDGAAGPPKSDEAAEPPKSGGPGKPKSGAKSRSRTRRRPAPPSEAQPKAKKPKRTKKAGPTKPQPPKPELLIGSGPSQQQNESKLQIPEPSLDLVEYKLAQMEESSVKCEPRLMIPFPVRIPTYSPLDLYQKRAGEYFDKNEVPSTKYKPLFDGKDEKVGKLLHFMRRISPIIPDMVLVGRKDSPPIVYLHNAVVSTTFDVRYKIMNDVYQLHINSKIVAQTEHSSPQSYKQDLAVLAFERLKRDCFIVIRKVVLEDLTHKQLNELEKYLIMPPDLSEPAPASVSKPAPDDVSENAPDGVSEPAPDDVSEPAPDDVSEPAPEGMSEPAPDDVSEPAPDDVSEPAPDDVSEPAPDGVLEPAPEGTSKPAPDSVSEPAPDGASEPAPDSVSVPAPDGVSEPAPDGVSKPAPNGVSKPAPNGGSKYPLVSKMEWGGQINEDVKKIFDYVDTFYCNLSSNYVNELHKIIKAYAENDSLSFFSFYPNLTRTQRTAVHRLCVRYNLKSRFLGDSDKRRIIIGKKYSPYDLIKILLRHDCETSTHRLIIPGIGMDQWKALKPKTALKSDRPPVEVEENIASELNNKARTKQLLRSVAEQSARMELRVKKVQSQLLETVFHKLCPPELIRFLHIRQEKRNQEGGAFMAPVNFPPAVDFPIATRYTNNSDIREICVIHEKDPIILTRDEFDKLFKRQLVGFQTGKGAVRRKEETIVKEEQQAGGSEASAQVILDPEILRFIKQVPVDHSEPTFPLFNPGLKIKEEPIDPSYQIGSADVAAIVIKQEPED